MKKQMSKLIGVVLGILVAGQAMAFLPKQLEEKLGIHKTEKNFEEQNCADFSGKWIADDQDECSDQVIRQWRCDSIDMDGRDLEIGGEYTLITKDNKGNSDIFSLKPRWNTSRSVLTTGGIFTNSCLSEECFELNGTINMSTSLEGENLVDQFEVTVDSGETFSQSCRYHREVE